MPASRSKSRRRGLGIELDGVSLHRDERPILDDIQWSLREGERWVLLGANGAGKTQLLKMLSGAVWPDAECRHALRYLWQGRASTLAEVGNHFAYLGPERQDRHERHDWNFTALEVVGTGLTRSDIPQGPLSAARHRRALAGLQALGVAKLATRRLLECSFGERRLVLLARALATNPRWLLLDELMAGLDARNRRRADRWLADFRGSWVLSTHRIEEIPSTATHLALIGQGRLLHSGPLTAELLALVDRTQRDLAAPARKRVDVTTRLLATRRRSTQVQPPKAAPLVSFDNVDVFLEYRPVLRGIDLAVREGECWVVHGSNGAGKSTLLRALYGDHPAALGGAIRRRGVGRGVPLEKFRRWCGIVAPHLQANPPLQTVLETVVSGLRSSIGLDGPPTAAESRRALGALRKLHLERFAPLPLRSLSYGQIRRVLFARALVIAPRLLLLDEALAGIDVATRESLRELIDRFVAGGGAVVLASHHRDEWPSNARHELELRAGRVRYRGPVRPIRG